MSTRRLIHHPDLKAETLGDKLRNEEAYALVEKLP